MGSTTHRAPRCFEDEHLTLRCSPARAWSVSWLPVLPPLVLPRGVPSGSWLQCSAPASSPVTVAGAASVSHRLPDRTLLRSTLPTLEGRGTNPLPAPLLPEGLESVKAARGRGWGCGGLWGSGTSFVAQSGEFPGARCVITVNSRLYSVRRPVGAGHSSQCSRQRIHHLLHQEAWSTNGTRSVKVLGKAVWAKCFWPTTGAPRNLSP